MNWSDKDNELIAAVEAGKATNPQLFWDAIAEQFGCSPGAAFAAHKRLMTKAAQGTTEPLESSEAAAYRIKIARQQSTIADLTRENKALSKHGVTDDDLIDRIDRHVTPLPYKPPTLAAGAKQGRKQTLFIVLSDWHFIQQFTTEVVRDLGIYNLDIAHRRVWQLLGNTRSLIRDETTLNIIDKVVIFAVGDMGHGDIHNRSDGTNQASSADATFIVADVLAQFVRWVHDVHPNVEVREDSGNHTRTQTDSKRQAPDRPEDSWDAVSYRIARRQLTEYVDSGEIKWEHNRAWGTHAEMSGLIVHAEHGNRIKSQLSLPYYGLRRLRAQLLEEYQAMGKTLSLGVSGHFHRVAYVDESKWILNGSLVGRSPYDAQVGFPPSQPCQVIGKIDKESGELWRIEFMYLDIEPPPHGFELSEEARYATQQP